MSEPRTQRSGVSGRSRFSRPSRARRVGCAHSPRGRARCWGFVDLWSAAARCRFGCLDLDGLLKAGQHPNIQSGVQPPHSKPSKTRVWALHVLALRNLAAPEDSTGIAMQRSGVSGRRAGGGIPRRCPAYSAALRARLGREIAARTGNRSSDAMVRGSDTKWCVARTAVARPCTENASRPIMSSKSTVRDTGQGGAERE
jgi:hypothetical protein